MSDVDTVRLLIADTATPTLFEDVQLQSFLDLESGVIKRAAADALDAIATSEALISKKITSQDLSTDGPAIAKALRDQAKTLRDQALQALEDDAVGVVINFDPNCYPAELAEWPYVGLC